MFPYTRGLYVVCACMSAAIWGFLAFQAGTTNNHPSTSDLVMVAAAVMAGVALGCAWALARGSREVGTLTPGAKGPEGSAMSLVIAMMAIGMGASAVLYDSPSQWPRWVIVVSLLTIGGLHFGLALMSGVMGLYRDSESGRTQGAELPKAN